MARECSKTRFARLDRDRYNSCHSFTAHLIPMRTPYTRILANRAFLRGVSARIPGLSES